MTVMDLAVDNPEEPEMSISCALTSTSSESEWTMNVDSPLSSSIVLVPILNHDMPLAPSTIQLTQSGQPQQQYQLPKKFHDNP